MAATSKKPLAAAAVDVTTDPLVIAINAYRFGGDQYDDLPGDMAEDEQEIEFDRLVGEPLAQLENWTAPAATFPSALAALHVAMGELALNSEDPLAASMLRAAIGFFEGVPPIAGRGAEIAAGASGGAAQ